MRLWEKFRLDFIYLLFFMSGMSALIYEIAWLNRIQMIMGYTIYALSTVLGSYLSGLAVGALAAHRFAGERKQCLSLYLLFELAIGLYGVLFAPILGLVHYLYAPIVTDAQIPLPLLSLVQFLFCGLVIFIPTFLMGATLPLLSSYLFANSKEAAERIGKLYGVNTLGALVGCVLTGYVFLPSFGYKTSIYIAALISVSLFMLAMLQFPEQNLSFAGLARLTPPRASYGKYFFKNLGNPLVWMMFFSGVLSLFTQLLWNRLAALSFGSSVYIFPLVTITILLGIFLGSLLSARFAKNKEESQRFLGVNLLLAITTLVLGNFLAGKFPLAVLWFNSQGLYGHGAYTLFQILVMAIVLLPSATLLGAVFPAALSLFTRDETDDTSLSIGFAYGMNIAGVLVGAILGGFVLIPQFGLDFMTKSIVAVTIVCLWIALEQAQHRKIHAFAVALLALIAITMIPEYDKTLITAGYFYNRVQTQSVKDFETYYDSLSSFHDTYRHAIIDYRDDAHGTVSIHESVAEPAGKWFKIDGKVDGHSERDKSTVRIVSYLPLLVKNNFENILTIGLGTGETANRTFEFPGMQSTKVIELSPSMIHFSQKYFYKNSSHLWTDSRFKVINRDGREYLLHTKEKFDLIISEPSNPWVQGVGSLFTTEFFEIVKDHLKPGGVGSLWFHSYGLSCDAFDSVVMAVYHVFPNVMIFKQSSDFYFLVSNDLPLDIKNFPPSMKHQESSFLKLFDGLEHPEDVSKEFVQSLQAGIWVKNRSQLDRFGAYGPRVNTDDNQFLQFSAGRTFRRKISCYLSY